MSQRRFLPIASLVLPLAVAGCAAQSIGQVSLSDAAPKAAAAKPTFVFASNAGFGRSVPSDGLARLNLKLQLNFLPGAPDLPTSPTAFRLLSAGNGLDLGPGHADNGNWTGAYVTINGATIQSELNHGFPNGDFTITGTGNVGGAAVPNDGATPTTATAVSTAWTGFPALRPGAYTARAFVVKGGTFAGTTYVATAGSSQLLASRERTFNLAPGVNNIFFALNKNGDFTQEKVSASSNNNVVTGNHIVKGDIVTLVTGIGADVQAQAIAKVEVYAYGTAVSGQAAPGVLLKTYTRGGGAGSNEASWNSFSWDTSTTAAFAPAGGAAGQAGTIRVVAYDATNTVIATKDFSFTGYGTPTANVILD